MQEPHERYRCKTKTKPTAANRQNIFFYEHFSLFWRSIERWKEEAPQTTAWLTHAQQPWGACSELRQPRREYSSKKWAQDWAKWASKTKDLKMGSLAVTHGCTLLRQSVKLCTAKLHVENQSKTYRDQSYPNAFRVKLSVLSRSNHSRQQATLQHTLCFSRSGLSQRVSLGIQFTYCSKVTKTKEWFLCKRQTGFPSLDEIPKSDPEDQKLLFSSKNSFFPLLRPISL